MTESIVLKLQAEVMMSDCDVVNVLRRAHVIASKLGLSEFDSWVSHELNGYHEGEAIPAYRHVKGELKAFNPYRGWIPTVIPNKKFEEAATERDIPYPLPEIISLLNNGKGNGFIIEISGGGQEVLNKAFNSPIPMQYAVHISYSAFDAIVEKVKNAVLEWTLKLEEQNIIGDGISFSQIEKEKAVTIPRTINYYFGTTSVIKASTDSVNVSVGNNNSISYSYDIAKEAVDDIKDTIKQDSGLNEEDKNAAIDLLKDIDSKITIRAKPSIVKSCLVGLKDFLINAGGSLSATLIAAKIQGLF